jgi:hypothetical protein
MLLKFFNHARVIPNKYDGKNKNKIKIWLTLLYAMPSGQGIILHIKGILQQDMGCSISLNYHTIENNGMVFHMINVTSATRSVT